MWHLYTLGEDVRDLVGDLEADFIPVRSLFEAGATVTLSSDWDVSPVNPFLGMANALHRDPQSVNLKVHSLIVFHLSINV